MIRNLLNEIKDIIEELFKKEEIWFFLFLLVIGGYLSFLLLRGVSPETTLAAIGRFLAVSWWLWVFFILLPMTASIWLYWKNEFFKSQIKWKLLEIKIPRENIKSPKAMEQVLAAMNSFRNAPGDIEERWWDGEVTRWFSLEIVSFSGEVHFYIRIYAKQKNLLEAALFSYYPDIEIEEVDDYVGQFPSTTEDMYQRGYDIWGTEMTLSQDALYPIKTYPHFVEAVQEEKMVDPLSTFLEVLGKLTPGETVGIQILIAPADRDWIDKWKGKLEKLRQPKTTAASKAEEGDEMGTGLLVVRSPGQTEILKEVENNLSKPAFDTLVRFIYLSPKETFYDSYARHGLVGAFNQYSALNLNSFRKNDKMSTRTRFWYFPYLFPNFRNEFKKQRLLRNYRLRDVPPETFMGRVITSHPFNWNFASRRFEMNTECVATIFHMPTETVLTVPHIRRVESRRASPPAGLAIFGGEEEIEKFK
jgi:hypothetical protein